MQTSTSLPGSERSESAYFGISFVSVVINSVFILSLFVTVQFRLLENAPPKLLRPVVLFHLLPQPQPERLRLLRLVPIHLHDALRLGHRGIGHIIDTRLKPVCGRGVGWL